MRDFRQSSGMIDQRLLRRACVDVTFYIERAPIPNVEEHLRIGDLCDLVVLNQRVELDIEIADGDNDEGREASTRQQALEEVTHQNGFEASGLRPGCVSPTELIANLGMLSHSGRPIVVAAVPA